MNDQFDHENIYGSIVSSHDLLNIDFPDIPWVVEGLVPAEGITIIGGKPGEYKSWISLEMTKCIANGESLFGKFPCKKRKVLVLDGENHPREVQKRIQMLGYSQEIDEEFYFSSQPDMKMDFDPDEEDLIFDQSDMTQEILELAMHQGVEVVIFDSLTRFHDSEENDAGAMSKVFQKFKDLTRAGATIIILHHTKKHSIGSEKDALRGSSDIMAAIDSYIHIGKKTGVQNSVFISNPKARYSPETDPFELKVASDDEHFSFEFQGSQKPMTEKLREDILNLLKEHGDGLKKGDIQKLLKSAEKSTKRIIDDLKIDGELVETKGVGNTKIYTLA